MTNERHHARWAQRCADLTTWMASNDSPPTEQAHLRGSASAVDRHAYGLAPAFHLNDPTGSLADHVKQVLTSGVLPGETHYQSFVRVRFANSVNVLRSAVRGAFTFAGGTDDAVMFVALRAGLLAAYTTEGAPVAVGQFTTEQLEGLGDAFVTVVTETQP